MADIVPQWAETNLIGYLDATASASASSITVKFYDKVTGAARTPHAKTKMFVIDKGTSTQPNQNYEIILCASHSTSAGVTTLASVTRGLAYSGTSVAAGTGKIHSAGAEIGPVDVHYLTTLLASILDGTASPPADLDLGSHKITNLATPTLNTDATTKAYVDGVALAGVPDANATTKGAVEIPSDTEAKAFAAAGSGSTTAEFALTPTNLKSFWDMVVTTDYTYGATIAAGNALYLDTADAKWKLADGDAAGTSDATFGIALDAGVDTDTGKRVQIAGVVTGLSGLTAGLQYVSATAGALTNTAPTYKKVVGFAPNTTTLILKPAYRVEELAGTNSSTTTANFNEAMTFFANTSMTGAQAEAIKGGIRLDTVTTSVTVSNSTTETTVETLTLNANTLSTNNVIHGYVHFSDWDVDNTDAKTIRVKLGGSTVCSAVLTNDAGVAKTNGTGTFHWYILGAGATNAQEGSISGWITFNNGSINTGNNLTFGLAEGSGTAAIDTTSNQTLLVTVQNSDTGAANAFTVNHAYIEKIISA